MKTRNRFYTTCIFTVLGMLLLSACGGGGGGGSGGSLATGTFTKTVVLDGVNGVFDNLFSTNTAMRYQFLYRASEVKGSGNVQSVSFRYKENELVAVTCPNVTLKMGHTSLADLTITYADNVEEGKGSFVTVLNGATVNIPAGTAGDYFTITLSTPFNYNGVDNLVVEIVRTSGCTDRVGADVSSAKTTYTAGVFNNLQSAPATGITSRLLAHAEFNFAGGDNHQVLGGSTSNTYPFSANTPHVQHLYLASEINGAGPITGLAYQMNDASKAATYTATIRLAHTTLATLGTTFADNFDAGTPVVVANAITFSIPAGLSAGDWFWVPLPDSTFTYNGTDNLIVEFDTTAATNNNNLRTTDFAGRRLFNDDNLALTGALTTSRVPNIKFRFNGGTLDVITDEGASADAVFRGLLRTGTMNLYRASELGTAATIQSVACRMNEFTSAASTYHNTKVILGHTNRDTLDTTSANNFTSQHVAFDGRFDIPAGLVRGDWITINLSAPFAYDGTSNLVVWMGTTVGQFGATAHACYMSTEDATRYPGQRGDAVPDIGIVSVQDFKFDMRLGLSN